MKTEYFTAAMQDAVDYPIHVRIAAAWIAAGKTEAEFHKAYCGPGHKHGKLIPMPIINNVYFSIRDLLREGIDARLVRLTA